MKKLLLSMAALALGLTVNAGVVTFDFTTDTYGLPPYDADTQDYLTLPATITSGDVQIVLNGTGEKAWRMWNDGLRQYKSNGANFTVSTLNGEKVTYVTWTGKAGLYFAPEGSEEELDVWEGDAESITLVTTSTGNAAVATITVGYGDATYSPEPEPDVQEFTVGEALDYIAAGNSGVAIVSGVVTAVTNFNSTYGSITYYIADNADDAESDWLQIYGGLNFNGTKFEAKTDVLVGAKVQVKGTLKLYTNTAGESTPEMDMNNVLLSYDDSNAEAPDVPSAPQGVLSVSEAIYDYLDKGYTGQAVVRGVVSEIKNFHESYGQMDYYIMDVDGGSSAELYIYNGYFLDGEHFTSEGQLEVGTVVEVSGELSYYYDTPEMGRGNYIVSMSDAGVDGIEIDSNAPVVYYNLQGVRVNNPSNGLYIIRQGNKSVKAIVK